MIIDAFLYHNEEDVLEIRLATLYDVVDRFVLVEGDRTHAGEPKIPLFWQSGLDRFEKYLDKVTHIIVNKWPEERGNVYDKAWDRERWQRDAILHGLTDCADDDLVVIGDADEIPNPEVLGHVADAYKNGHLSGIHRLKQRMFYYFLNCENKEGWDWQKVATCADVKQLTPCGIRYPPAAHIPLIENGGHHFSFLGDAAHISQKLSDYSHREYDTPEINDIEVIKRKIAKGEDIFGRDLKYEFVGIDDDYPLYIRENLVRFTPLLWDVCEPPSNVVEFKKPLTVTAEVSTKDRYQTTLPLALSAIINQTRKPNKLKIYDDGEQVNLFDLAPFSGLLRVAQDKGIEVEVLSTPRKGQVTNHQHCLEVATTDAIWRVDDDEIPEPDCLAHLLAEFKDGVGAVGGLVHHPNHVQPLPAHVNGSLNDVAIGLNMQWYDFNGSVRDAEHLYSTFAYLTEAGKAAGGYPRDLSVVGHHEETIFTHSIKRAGYGVKITPYAKTIHLQEPSGGIRSFTDGSLWEYDKQVFQRYLKAWGVNSPETTLAVLDCGLGDTLIFKACFNELQRRNPRKWCLAVCYPSVFDGMSDVTVISIADAKLLVGSRLDDYLLYKWMWDKNWTGNLVDAMYEFYA